MLRWAAAVLLMSVCEGCAGNSVEYSVVLQDKYDYMTCPELIKVQGALATREKELTDQVSKAEASVGGVVVGMMAYRTDLLQTREHLRIAAKAARNKGCTSPPVTAPAPPPAAALPPPQTNVPTPLHGK